MGSLPSQKFVVAAAGLVGIVVADARPGLVDGAATRLHVEKHADGAVNLVLLMTENLLTVDELREAALCRFDVDPEMLREPVEVALTDDDAIVAAAIRRALRAIVK